MDEPDLTQEQAAVLHGLAGLAERYPASKGWGLLSNGLVSVGATLVASGLLRASSKVDGDSKLFRTTPLGEEVHARLFSPKPGS